MNESSLINLAAKARKNAIAPYSHFKVGAVLLAGDGTIFTGSNIESLSSGLALCAERVALAKAVSEGHRDFEMLVLVADSENICSPCGICRQALYEFSPEMTVLMSNLRGGRKKMPVKDLLPDAFRLKDDRALGNNRA